MLFQAPAAQYTCYFFPSVKGFDEIFLPFYCLHNFLVVLAVRMRL